MPTLGFLKKKKKWTRDHTSNSTTSSSENNNNNTSNNAVSTSPTPPAPPSAVSAPRSIDGAASSAAASAVQQQPSPPQPPLQQHQAPPTPPATAPATSAANSTATSSINHGSGHASVAAPAPAQAPPPPEQAPAGAIPPPACACGTHSTFTPAPAPNHHHYSHSHHQGGDNSQQHQQHQQHHYGSPYLEQQQPLHHQQQPQQLYHQSQPQSQPPLLQQQLQYPYQQYSNPHQPIYSSHQPATSTPDHGSRIAAPHDVSMNPVTIYPPYNTGAPTQQQPQQHQPPHHASHGSHGSHGSHHNLPSINSLISPQQSPSPLPQPGQQQHDGAPYSQEYSTTSNNPFTNPSDPRFTQSVSPGTTGLYPPPQHHYAQQQQPQQPQQPQQHLAPQHMMQQPTPPTPLPRSQPSPEPPQRQPSPQPPQAQPDSQVRVTKGKYSLGDFEILRTLGTGSFGRVHLVQSRHNQRFYAVKVLKKAQVVKMKQVEHTNDERRMLGEVKHPFLITLWGTFQDSKNLYMVMDFVEGGELFSLLRKSGRFPNPVAKFYAAEVTLALEYLHSKNIIYRDLKPENLLLDRHGHLKITDFGFAKRVPDKTWTLCGTPDYLAPEVVSNKGYNKSVDWWSLGILIYEMLCGYTPFWDGGSPMKIYENILKGRVKYPPYINPDVQDLLERLITADLTKRLGNLFGGPSDVKNHAWFAEVTWDRLSRKDIDAPYTPPVRAGAGDASQFDRYPEEPEKYGQGGSDEHGDLFVDF